jgi:hypothetical protein
MDSQTNYIRLSTKLYSQSFFKNLEGGEKTVRRQDICVVAIPQSHFWPIIVSVWKNYRDGNGEEPEEKKVQWQAQSGIQVKERSQGLTLLLRLWSAHKKGSIMTALRKTQ